MSNSNTDNYFITFSSYVDNFHIFVLGECVAQFGDEHLQAADVDHPVISEYAENSVTGSLQQIQNRFAYVGEVVSDTL